MQINRALPALEFPYLCHSRFVLRLLVMAQAVSVVLAFAPGIAADPWHRLGLISVFVHWVALLTTVCFCQLRRQLNRLQPAAMLISCIALFEVATILVSVIAHSWLASQSLHMSQSLPAFVLAITSISIMLMAPR